MKKLIAVLALLALVTVFSCDRRRPHARTAREQARSEPELPPQGPVNEYTDFAGYGEPADGPNATDSYATSANTTADPSAIDNPDGLTDVGAVTGLDWAFTDLQPDYFVLPICAGQHERAPCGLRAEVRPAADTRLVAHCGTDDASAPARPRRISL